MAVVKRKRKLWNEFHKLRLTELKDMWCTFLHGIDVIEEADPLIMQYVFDKMFSSVIRTHFPENSSDYNPAELTGSEHNALRYAAGYVPRALKAKISQGSHPHKESFLQCLSGMGTKGRSSDRTPSVQEFTKQWISAVDRGGLTFVSDETYTLFYQMEMRMQKHLHELTSQKHIDKVAVMEEVAADYDIQFQWCLLSTDINEEDASQELLQKVIELWLTIRGFSTAGAYVEYYKQCKERTLKKSTSLRHSLKCKHAEIEQ